MTNPDNTMLYAQVHQTLGPQVDEKIIKGPELSGQEVTLLKYREHIFINGKHAVVIDVKHRGNNVELVYVKGRKAFGREQYMDVPFNSPRTGILMGQKVDPGNVFLPL